MDISQTRTDAATTLKCLTIFVELMTSGDMCTMTDTIRSYMEELVIPSIPHSCPAIRKQAIKALGLCALCDQEVARKFLPIFLQVLKISEDFLFILSVLPKLIKFELLKLLRNFLILINLCRVDWFFILLFIIFYFLFAENLLLIVQQLGYYASPHIEHFSAINLRSFE